MDDILELDRLPRDRPEIPGGQRPVARGIGAPAARGRFPVAGVRRPEAPARGPAGPGARGLVRGRNRSDRPTPVAGARERPLPPFPSRDRGGGIVPSRERIGFHGRAA